MTSKNLLSGEKKTPSPRGSSRLERVKSFNKEILFTCPELGEGAHPKCVWAEKVKAYIEGKKKALDRVRACIVAINTFNSESDTKFTLKLLHVYLSNLIMHPDENKFRKIKVGNPFLQKLKTVVGAIEFLLAIGFQQKRISIKTEIDLKEELYLVHYPHPRLALPQVLQELASVRGFNLSLFRNVSLTVPVTDPAPEEPDEFYEWTIEDMEREYLFRKKQSEKNQLLISKKMKNEGIKSESDYTFIRVRLPDGLVIQATFSTKESLADLISIVRKKVVLPNTFFFVLPPSQKFFECDEIKTFLELDLFPSATLLLRW